MMEGRISRDEMLISVAHQVALRGTCSRLKVGAVLARSGRILSTGYNGAPSGMPHCEHPIREDSSSGCTISVHAETNAVAWAARCGVEVAGAELFCTDAPCLECAKVVINAGIIRVVFERPYRLTAGEDLLRAANVPVDHLPRFW